MAEPYKHICKVDLNQQLVRRDVGLLATFDSKANRFGAELYRDGASVSASGYTVNGYFIRPNEETVSIPGTVEGNLVYVDLLPGCYHYDGAFEFSLKIKQGDVEQTVLLCYGNVERSRTDATASGGEVVVTVTNAKNLDGKPPEYYLPAVNLLDNSDWRIKKNIVNQCDITTASGRNTPLWDRWLIYSDDGLSTATLNDGYVTLTSLGKFTALLQRFTKNSLSAAKYTMAYKKTDGTIVIDNNPIKKDQTACDYVQVILPSGVASSINIEWVALYEGTYTADTLPPFVQRPYAVELAECRRYWRKMVNILAYTQSSSAQWLPVNLHFEPMAATPNVHITRATLDSAELDLSQMDGFCENNSLFVSVRDTNHQFGGGVAFKRVFLDVILDSGI